MKQDGRHMALQLHFQDKALLLAVLRCLKLRKSRESCGREGKGLGFEQDGGRGMFHCMRGRLCTLLDK